LLILHDAVLDGEHMYDGEVSETPEGRVRVIGFHGDQQDIGVLDLLVVDNDMDRHRAVDQPRDGQAMLPDPLGTRATCKEDDLGATLGQLCPSATQGTAPE
jgi:hypothetical protein